MESVSGERVVIMTTPKTTFSASERMSSGLVPACPSQRDFVRKMVAAWPRSVRFPAGEQVFNRALGGWGCIVTVVGRLRFGTDDG